MTTISVQQFCNHAVSAGTISDEDLLVLKREVLPEHVANAAAVLTSNELSHTTGLHIPVDAGVAAALSAFHAFAADRPGVIVEDKGVSAGLHYRQASDQAAAAAALAKRLQVETGLTLQPGHMVLELKTPGADKGTAVTAFMQEAPFKGAVPVMLGDDLTDEYGFEAAAELGGYGVLVGPERETAARYRLDDVDAVLTWLEAVAKA